MTEPQWADREPQWADRDAPRSKRTTRSRSKTVDYGLEVTLASAQTALKTAVVINGAGAIAILVLFAQAFKDTTSALPGAAQFAAATLWLVAGTAFAGGATGGGALPFVGVVGTAGAIG